MNITTCAALSKALNNQGLWDLLITDQVTNSSIFLLSCYRYANVGSRHTIVSPADWVTSGVNVHKFWETNITLEQSNSAGKRRSYPWKIFVMPLKILSTTIFRHLGFLRMTIAPSIYTIHIYTVTRLIRDIKERLKIFEAELAFKPFWVLHPLILG